MTMKPYISVVLPGYNESGNIDEMVREVVEVLRSLDKSFEILYVDDGSTDDSVERLRHAAEQFPELRPLFHRSNFGQSAAILTGIRASAGELVVTLDSDLQNDPADIPSLVAALDREHADAVCGIRSNRKDSRMKLISSRIANRVRGWALKDGITDAGCAMRVMKRSALEQLPGFRALHRFLPTILKIHGYKVIEMPINHRPRVSGQSKYGVGNRLWVGIQDILGIRWYRKRHFSPDRIENES